MRLKMKNKLAVLILIITCSFGLTACGTSQSYKEKIPEFIGFDVYAYR